MAILYLMRHAQAEPGGGGVLDHDRPLDEQGRAAAQSMGRNFAQRGAAPDLVLCSTARRALETWHALAGEWRLAPDLVEEDGLYLSSAEALLERLALLPPTVRAPLVIGHNPGLFQLVLALAPRGEETAMARLGQGFPAGTVAAIGLRGNLP